MFIDYLAFTYAVISSYELSTGNCLLGEAHKIREFLLADVQRHILGLWDKVYVP
jgi:hypothetical protein